MANLKADLLNELRNQKYYAEMELLRLAQDPTMKYRAKIFDIDAQLAEIAVIDAKIGLANQYFQEPQQQPVNVPDAPAPEITENVPEQPSVVTQHAQPPVAAKPHAGQSHGE